MEQMQLQAEHVGTQFVYDYITEVDLETSPFRLVGDSGQEYRCDALIVSTGSQAKWLGLASEEKLQGHGVSACATCDGFFYRGKDVVVVGGGNTAVEEALYLSGLASHVTLVHRRDDLRAERILQKRLFDKANIDIVWNHRVEEILGNPDSAGVTGVNLVDVETGTERQIEASGVFVAIGHNPSTELFKDQLRLSDHGYIETDPDSTATNIEGVFAAGDVTDDKFRQAVTAAGMGCMAALEVESFLAA